MNSGPTVTVTATYADGSRHTLRLRASSLYQAVFAFNHEVICGTARDLPRPEMDTEFEVQLEDGRVLRTTFAKAMAWGNRKAET